MYATGSVDVKGRYTEDDGEGLAVDDHAVDDRHVHTVRDRVVLIPTVTLERPQVYVSRQLHLARPRRVLVGRQDHVESRSVGHVEVL